MKKRNVSTIILLVFLAVFLVGIFIISQSFGGLMKMQSFHMLLILVVFIIFFIIFSIINKNSRRPGRFFISSETTPEFENLYTDLCSNYFNNLKKFQIITRCFIICVFIFLAFLFIFPNNIVKLASIILVFACVILSIVFKNKYVAEYKNVVIYNFVKLFNHKLDYSKNSEYELFMKSFIDSNFEVSGFSKFYSDDYIKGYLNENTFIRMSDIKVEKIVRDKRDNTREKITLFEGIFAFTTSIKNINTYLKISLNRFRFFKPRNTVEMDSSEFESYFDVVSPDKILTMRILTHDVMDTLIDFYKTYNLSFEIAFKNNFIYLRFYTGPMFEPKIWNNSLDKKLLYTYYCILSFIIAVSKNVNKALEDIEI